MISNAHFDTIFVVKHILYLLLLISLFLIPHTQIRAATQWGDCVYEGTDVATMQCLVPLFRNIVVAIVQLAGVALFIMFVVAGFNFLLSGGDPKKLEQAKSTLTYAILGLVVIVVSYLIIQLISTITGVSGLNEFNIPAQ